MSQKTVFTIGTDPEFFLQSQETGTFVSAIPYIRGSKTKPMELPKGSTVQRDNVAVEFATPPRRTEKAFVNAIKHAFIDVENLLPKGLKIAASASEIFDEIELTHPEAREFGCDPDFNAWYDDMVTCERDDNCADMPLRSAGAHIHVGYVKSSGNDFLQDEQGKRWMIRTMDVLLGFVATVLDNTPESLRRRELYGKAGSYRPTPYGVEYRTLSNFWLKHPQLCRLMFRLTKDCCRLMQSGVALKIIEAIGADKIQEIINEGKADEALSWIEFFVDFLSPSTNKLLAQQIRDIDVKPPDLKTCWRNV